MVFLLIFDLKVKTSLFNNINYLNCIVLNNQPQADIRKLKPKSYNNGYGHARNADYNNRIFNNC